ncbi:unnamed protein product [Darwinula stevensoni]|uniref:Uncharacterized protein n=1 Tax=Darwinula stevensoni TaxID=69355 RepID=A0A7R8X1Y3_9CRUS|nr:unnamed protein product [Darwinula stevensoni]CAG0883241.1 unnamed protein product [Darwinula stevensoni]
MVASMGALTLRSFGLGDSKAVETEEWLSFLRKTFDECLGSVENLADPSFLAVLLGPLRSSQVSPKVVSRIALLFSVPLVHPCTHESREKVIQAYLDSRVVANLFYAARHVLQSAESEPTDEEWETLEDLVELLSHLVHLDAEFAVALCDAVCVMNAYGTVRRLVTSTWCRAGRDVPRISANTLAILAQILRVNPENSAVVQEVLWDSKTGAMAVPISTLMHHGEELVSSRAGTLARFASILLPHLAPMLA